MTDDIRRSARRLLTAYAERAFGESGAYCRGLTDIDNIRPGQCLPLTNALIDGVITPDEVKQLKKAEIPEAFIAELSGSDGKQAQWERIAYLGEHVVSRWWRYDAGDSQRIHWLNELGSYEFYRYPQILDDIIAIARDDDADKSVRWAAMDLLAQVERPTLEVIGSLITLAKEGSSYNVRLGASTAILKITTFSQEAEPLLTAWAMKACQKDEAFCNAAIAAMMRMTSFSLESLKVIFSTYEDGGYRFTEVRDRIAGADWKKSPPEVIQYVREMAFSRNNSMAIFLVTHVDPFTTAEGLQSITTNTHLPAVWRLDAVKRAGELLAADPNYFGVLVNLLDSPDKELADAARDALGRATLSPRGLEQLKVMAMAHPTLQNRLFAIQVLEKALPLDARIPLFQKLLDDKSREVVVAAMNGLVSASAEDAAVRRTVLGWLDHAANADARKVALMVLGTDPAISADDLEKRLREIADSDGDKGVRWTALFISFSRGYLSAADFEKAAQALGDGLELTADDASTVVTGLLSKMKAPSPDAVAYVIKRVTKETAPASIEKLVDYLKGQTDLSAEAAAFMVCHSKVQADRRAAISRLAKVPTVSTYVLGVLHDALNDPDPGIKEDAVEILTGIQNPSGEIISTASYWAAHDSNPLAKRVGIQILGGVKALSPQAMGILHDALNDSDEVKQAAMTVLAAIHDASNEVASTACYWAAHDSNPLARLAGVTILGNVQPNTLPSLCVQYDTVQDANGAKATAKSKVKSPTLDALGVVHDSLNDSDAKVVDAAKTILTGILKPSSVIISTACYWAENDHNPLAREVGDVLCKRK